jgi:hypothetical protein
MSGMADISPEVESPEWLRLADNPSKIGPPYWLPLDDAYQRMRDSLKSSDLAKRDLHAWLRDRDGQLSSAVRRISFNGEQSCDLLRPEFWQEVTLWVETDRADHIGVRYHDRSRRFDAREHFFVWAAALERLCPTTSASAPAPSKKANRTLRRRHSKYVWDEICGEIARLCHDKSGRVCVPENESELAEKVLQFCQNTYECEPPPSELRKTVSVICAVLRQVIPANVSKRQQI